MLTLVRAARQHGNQNCQIPKREELLVRRNPARLGSARNEAQAMAFHESVQVVATYSRKVGNLRMSENLLFRFYRYHLTSPPESQESFNFLASREVETPRRDKRSPLRHGANNQ